MRYTDERDRQRSEGDIGASETGERERQRSERDSGARETEE